MLSQGRLRARSPIPESESTSQRAAYKGELSPLLCYHKIRECFIRELVIFCPFSSVWASWIWQRRLVGQVCLEATTLSQHHLLPCDWSVPSAATSCLPVKPWEELSALRPWIQKFSCLAPLLSMITSRFRQSVGISLKSISKSRRNGWCPVAFIWTSKEPKRLWFSKNIAGHEI